MWPPYTQDMIPDPLGQRLVLLLADTGARGLRPGLVKRLAMADVPFAMAVVGSDEPLEGLGDVADRMSDFLRTFRPHCVHVAVGRGDLRRTIEADGVSYPVRRIADLRADLHRVADAVKQSGETDLVVATLPPVVDERQDEIRGNDVDRLNVVIREVGRQRDFHVDRWDLAVDPVANPPHLAANGIALTDAGGERAGASAAVAIVDTLLRADHPWRRLGRGGVYSMEGIPRPRHIELT